MAEIEINEKDLMGRLMSDLKRAANLGLIPQEGAKISARGEFIVSENNIEMDENRKRKVFKEFPKTLHAWPEGHAEPLTLSVKNRAEEQKAIEAGWSIEPHHGPSGRLVQGAPAEPEPEPEVREFAPPGQKQPWEQSEPDPEAAKGEDTEAAKPKKARKK